MAEEIQTGLDDLLHKYIYDEDFGLEDIAESLNLDWEEAYKWLQDHLQDDNQEESGGGWNWLKGWTG